jgi:hypothetical protein
MIKGRIAARALTRTQKNGAETDAALPNTFGR